MLPTLLPHDIKYYELAGEQVAGVLRAISDKRVALGSASYWVTSRVKADKSIRDKLRRKQAIRPSYTIEHMTDLVGVRVIVESIAAAKLLSQFIRRHHTFVIREADCEEYIELPRADGYRGVHLILEREVRIGHCVVIPVELQIRTILQHQWSELSHSEFYKSVREIPPNLLVRMRALSESLHCADIESDNLKRERVLDECQRSLLEHLRANVLERFGVGSCDDLNETEVNGRIAIGMLEFDKQLRLALVADGSAQLVAIKAMSALTHFMREHDIGSGELLESLIERVKGMVYSLPDDI
jgi:ppGpp synthetase/RelA/SpoT-type nucleotidyltranferase